jgi:hypothetical protein
MPTKQLAQGLGRSGFQPNQASTPTNFLIRFRGNQDTKAVGLRAGNFSFVLIQISLGNSKHSLRCRFRYACALYIASNVIGVVSKIKGVQPTSALLSVTSLLRILRLELVRYYIYMLLLLSHVISLAFRTVWNDLVSKIILSIPLPVHSFLMTSLTRHDNVPSQHISSSACGWLRTS